MSHRDIRQAIAGKLAAASAAAKVHQFERYAVSQKDFRAFYEQDGKVAGWFVRRVAWSETRVASTFDILVETWRIRGFFSLDDDAQSELAVDDVIDALCDAFRNDETIGGAVDTTAVDGEAGLQGEDSGPVMFAGVLCHGVTMRLKTQRSVEVGVEAIDDFVIGNVKWDKAPVDGVTDAEDTLQLEQPA